MFKMKIIGSRNVDDIQIWTRQHFRVCRYASLGFIVKKDAKQSLFITNNGYKITKTQ
ncbi:hypothetical protein AGMMS49574_27850 [Bacteroidia bacterium]|nr:hypothetical protein AGMMS49574_27850 [Bacteroidia bacterium]